MGPAGIDLTQREEKPDHFPLWGPSDGEERAPEAEREGRLRVVERDGIDRTSSLHAKARRVDSPVEDGTLKHREAVAGKSLQAIVGGPRLRGIEDKPVAERVPVVRVAPDPALFPSRGGEERGEGCGIASLRRDPRRAEHGVESADARPGVADARGGALLHEPREEELAVVGVVTGRPS